MRGERASRRSAKALLNNNELNKNNHERTHCCRTVMGALLRMRVARGSDEVRVGRRDNSRCPGRVSTLRLVIPQEIASLDLRLDFHFNSPPRTCP